MEIKEVPVEMVEVTDEDVFALLDELITSGRVTKEFKINDKLRITLQTLSTNELLEAESINLATSDIIPSDVIQRARVVNILAYATVAINGKKIIVDNEETTRKNRGELRSKFVKLSPSHIEKLYNNYLEIVAKVNNQVLDEVENNIENF